MAQINSANEVLSDDRTSAAACQRWGPVPRACSRDLAFWGEPELRAQYDAGDDPNDPARNQQQGGNPFGGGFPGGGFNFFGGGGPGGFQFHF